MSRCSAAFLKHLTASVLSLAKVEFRIECSTLVDQYLDYLVSLSNSHFAKEVSGETL
jgi:hypothetical protein